MGLIFGGSGQGHTGYGEVETFPEVEVSAAPFVLRGLGADVGGQDWGAGPPRAPVLDSFPRGVLDLVALRRLVPQQAGLYDRLDKVSAFEELLTSRDLPLPGPRSTLSDAGVQACVDSGVLVAERRAAPSRCGLSLFTVDKAGGKLRLVVDARALNKAMLPPPKFSLPSPHELSVMILGGSAKYGAIADFKGFFWQFPVCAEVGRYFGVRCGTRRLQLRRMAMGWTWAAYIAQRTSEGLLGEIHGKHAAAWIDDNLVLGDTRQVARSRMQSFLGRVAEVGGEINLAKSSVEPRQSFVYAGIEWHLGRGARRLPAAWRAKARANILEVAAVKIMPIRRVWVGIGAIVWATFALDDRFCVFPDLLAWVSEQGRAIAVGTRDWDSEVGLSTGLLRDLRRAAEALVADTWRVPQWRLAPEAVCDTVVFSDACPEGWGFIVGRAGGSAAQRKWGTWDRLEDIFLLELRAMIWGVECALASGARDILVIGDNTGVVAVLTKGHCGLRVGNTLLAALFAKLRRGGARVLSRWISTDNMPADALSRWGCAGADTARVPCDGIAISDEGFRWAL